MSRAPRVLVVDDDRRFRAALVETLEELGCAPGEVPGAQQALRELETGRYDLVLLDLRMPGLSGHDLLRRLPRGVRVIGMSGAGTVDDVVALMRRGAIDFLRKPFGPGPLEQALRRALGGLMPPPGAGGPTDSGWSGPHRMQRHRQAPEPERRPTAGLCEQLAASLDEGGIELPVIAPIAAQVRRLRRDPAVSVEAVVQVLRKDPAITATLLKLANSTYYRGQVPVEGLRAACVRLGNAQALSVAHEVLVRGLFDVGGDLQRVAEAMWRNTTVTAFVARELALRGDLAEPEEVHLAAMLHNLGELVLLREVARLLGSGRCPEDTRERLATRIRERHEDLGRRLMKAWSMPGDLVLLAGAHHRKPWRPESREATLRRRVILAAWSGACRAGYDYLPGGDLPEPEELLKESGLGLDDLDEALEEAARWLAETNEEAT